LDALQNGRFRQRHERQIEHSAFGPAGRC
jgi:hypothetical protein